MAANDSKKWDVRYSEASVSKISANKACEVLLQNQHLLPRHGRALDLACGLGANALLLAESGLEAYAWDSSSVAIEKLQQAAQVQRLSLIAEVRDVVAAPPTENQFDVIVVCRFLERSLALRLAAALRPGGLLFYQTFTQIRVSAGGPKNTDYLLADNELLQLFAALRVRVYREENQLGDQHHGLRNCALFIGEKV